MTQGSDQTFSGVISGTGTLTKTGTGTLLLTAANTVAAASLTAGTLGGTAPSRP